MVITSSTSATCAGNGGCGTYMGPNAYGHTGFTGTCVWMDPENKILYIFLSNRVYPDAGNNKLRQYNIRTRIHDVIYKSLQKT